MAANYALQVAVYNALNADAVLGALITGIHDNPQQVANPDSNSAFPYVTISTGSVAPWDDDHDKGGDATVEVHTWSRERHSLEAKQVMDAIYNILHRGTLTISGWRFVGCDLISSENPQYDPDGITRHGVQSFRVIFEVA
jgi:hypothetical protein